MIENFFAQVLLSSEYVGFVVSYIVAGAVIVPLLGHATWHAYKDLVE
jgi:uncharacterized membrane protein